MRTLHFKRFPGLAFISLFGLSVALPVQANVVQQAIAELLHKVEPHLSFEFSGDNVGVATIVESGVRIDFQLDGRIYPLESGEECFAGVLQYPRYQNSKLKSFFEDGLLEEAQFKPILFSLQTPYANPEIQVRVLDERALALLVMDIYTDDILGEGSKQITFTGVSHYAFEDPNEVISTERMYVYDLPSLTERVAITRVRNIIPTETVRFVDIFVQEINIERGTATTPPMLLVRSSEGTEKEYSLEPGNSDPLPSDTPWIRDEEALEARKRADAPRKLRVQIVDSEGNPVAGALVRGEERSVKWDTSSEVVRISLTADAEGRFTQLVSEHRIALDVYMPGFDKESIRYDREEIPEDEVQVTLVREGVRVPLRIATQVGRTWRTDAEMYEVGLRFGESSNPFIPGEWVDQKDDADIWFSAEKTRDLELGNSVACESNSEAWTITLEGVGGWELQEGPRTEDWRSGIREAPAEGYKKTATFLGKCNVRDRNFYLRYDGGKKYGILTSLMFADKSTTESFLRELLCDFVLQMEENGRRSLDAQ